MAEPFDAAELFTLTKQGLDFFNELFDFPYPWGKYDQAFVPEYNLGAMENPGLVTFTESYVFTSRAADAQYQARANTILHEMAHMWFGDLVTMQWWDDLWLKESFADYMGTLGVDRATDWDTAWVNFANNRKAWAYVQDQLPTTHPIVADIPDLEAAKQNFDGITYAKGASVLKQLVAYVGFDAFIAGSRQYFRDHAYGNTTLADLLAALSAASGRDLAAGPAQWLQTSGISTLSSEIDEPTTASWRRDAASRTRGPRHRPAGTAAAPAADRPLRLRRRRRPGPHATASKPTSRRRGRRSPSWPASRGPALLLVNDDDLTYAKVRLDPLSEATVRGSLDRISDPMARALCWTALWNSARDARHPRLPLRGRGQRFGPSETGIGVLLNVLGNASTAVEHYVPAGAAGRGARDFLSAAGRRAAQRPRRAPTSSWPGRGRWLPSAGTTAAGCRPAPRPPGRHAPWSTASRWTRSSAGTSGTPWRPTARPPRRELDAELARDTTAPGRAGHATALAARPEAGRQGGRLEGRGPRHGTVQPAAERHHRRFQHRRRRHCWTLHGPLFRVPGTVWADRSIEIASRIVRGPLPGGAGPRRPAAPAGGHPVVVRTDNWLADHPDAPRALRRIIIEQRSHLHRALTAQAVTPQNPDRLLRNCPRQRPLGPRRQGSLAELARRGAGGEQSMGLRGPGAATPRCRTWPPPARGRRPVRRR